MDPKSKPEGKYACEANFSFKMSKIDEKVLVVPEYSLPHGHNSVQNIKSKNVQKM